MQAAFDVRDREVLRPLFAETRIARGMIEAVLCGRHGQVWCDRIGDPHAAVIAAGDFMLCGGEAGLSAQHLLRTALQSARREWLVWTPGEWRRVLADTADARWETRWGFDHEVQPEDTHLWALVRRAKPSQSFQPLTGDWVEACRKEEWSRDFVSEFADTALYEQLGLGMLVMEDGRPVAGASSYLSYPKGVEVQVQSAEGCEGRGLATLASAALILAAHRKGWIASWDAANPASAHMAEKLGYKPIGSYEVAVVDKRNASGKSN